MKMEELINHSGFEYFKFIDEVLNEHDDLFKQYINFIQATLEKAVDKEHFINLKIVELEDNFLNNKPNPAGIYCYAEATPLLQYGFNVIRNFPAYTMSSIFEAIEKHETFFKFYECKEECIYMPTFDDSYFGKKICDLNYSEALIEAIYFVVQGFNFAKIYSQLTDIKNNRNRNYEKYHETEKIILKDIKPSRNPIFKPESIDLIFNLIKDYFPEQKAQLLQVLKTGKVSDEKLLFNGNGKTLLDFFKQLFKGQFLIMSFRKDLQSWISTGFMFLDDNKWKPITEKYASKIISENARAARGKRLINVENVNGKFEIIPLSITNRKNNIK